MFPCGAFFSGAFDKIFVEVPQFHKHPCPEKFLIPHLHQRITYFAKKFHFKCLTMFSIRLCLDNCSLICTVTFCYILHRTHSEFYHIQHSALSGLCWHIQSYSALLRHTQGYSAPYETLAYSQPCHILSTSIFKTGGLFKILRNVDQAYS